MDMNRWTKVLTVNEDSEMGCALTDFQVGEPVRAEGCQDRMMNGEIGTVLALDRDNNCLVVAFDLHLGTKNLPTLKARKCPLWQTLGRNGVEYEGAIRQIKNRGFGFIKPGPFPLCAASDVYFHARDCDGDNVIRFDELNIRDIVAFRIGLDRKRGPGATKAVRIRLVQASTTEEVQLHVPPDAALAKEMLEHLDTLQSNDMALVTELTAQAWTHAVGPEAVTLERITRIAKAHMKNGRASFELRTRTDGELLIKTAVHLQPTTAKPEATSPEIPDVDVEMISDTEYDWLVPGVQVEVMVPFSTSNPEVILDAEELGTYVHPHEDRSDIFLMYFQAHENEWNNQWWIQKKHLCFLREHHSPEPGRAGPPPAPATGGASSASGQTPKPEHKAMPVQARQGYPNVQWKNPPGLKATAGRARESTSALGTNKRAKSLGGGSTDQPTCQTSN